MPPVRRRPIDIRTTGLRKVDFPDLGDITVLNFVEEDKCWEYQGMDQNGNKIYKQVTCPWDTITFFDPDEPGG